MSATASDVNTDGVREVLGMAIGPSEAKPFWTSFLRSLTRRGLRGVKLVISDAHEELKAAAAKVLKASKNDEWQLQRHYLPLEVCRGSRKIRPLGCRPSSTEHESNRTKLTTRTHVQGRDPKWRRVRDSNPRWAFDPYTLSRGAPSTTRPTLRRAIRPTQALSYLLPGGRCPGRKDGRAVQTALANQVPHLKV
jgi:hypothetical protein